MSTEHKHMFYDDDAEGLGAVRYVCAQCGSSSVLRDAWAEWDEVAQEWALAFTCDSSEDVCRDCGARNSFEPETIPQEQSA